MKKDFEEILFTSDEIQERVRELGTVLTLEYAGRNPILIGVLKGSFVFLSDLVRHIEAPIEIRFVNASSYGYNATTSGIVEIAKALDFDVVDRDIIIVEDILDSGNTLKAICAYIGEMKPRSIKLVALLDKKECRKVEIEADYVGFECPNKFVVGYGLDYAERYRNLPYIAVLRQEIYS